MHMVTCRAPSPAAMQRATRFAAAHFVPVLYCCLAAPPRAAAGQSGKWKRWKSFKNT